MLITRTAKVLSVFALIATVVVPVSSFAATATTTLKGDFCTNVDSIASKTNVLLAKKQSQADALKAKEVSAGSKLYAKRDQWNNNRDGHFSKLEAKAKTDAQKQIVATYEATINTGVATKRAAIDSAIATFSTGVSQLIDGRKTGIDGALATLTQSVDTLVATAKSECANGVTSKDAKAHLQTGITSAKATFKTSVEQLPKVKDEVAALQVARKTSISATEATFKTLVSQATQDLKTALGTVK